MIYDILGWIGMLLVLLDYMLLSLKKIDSGVIIYNSKIRR